jgi:hypothetical protein
MAIIAVIALAFGITFELKNHAQRDQIDDSGRLLRAIEAKLVKWAQERLRKKRI